MESDQRSAGQDNRQSAYIPLRENAKIARKNIKELIELIEDCLHDEPHDFDTEAVEKSHDKVRTAMTNMERAYDNFMARSRGRAGPRSRDHDKERTNIKPDKE